MDNLPEVLQMRKVFNKIGVTLTTLSAYIPQSNELTEQINQIFMVNVRAMIKRSWLSYQFWGFAVLHAAELHN